MKANSQWLKEKQVKTVEYTFESATRKSLYSLYAIGDAHIGALNCAEEELMSLVGRIAADPNALWIGGGDMLDAVILQDVKRFDISALPNWMVEGDADGVRERVGDIIAAQKRRFLSIVNPIKDKCLGLIEGNHEYAMYKHHNRNVMQEMCETMNVPNLTDCAFIRLRFKRLTSVHSGVNTVTVFICHGHGEGRSSGAEPNRLFKLAADKQADIVLTGHSHTFHIHPPIPMLILPHGGRLLPEPIIREKYVANWGSYLFTYKRGPSTYASRANYPVRPMYTVETTIKPHHSVAVSMNDGTKERAELNIPVIEMRQLKL